MNINLVLNKKNGAISMKCHAFKRLTSHQSSNVIGGGTTRCYGEKKNKGSYVLYWKERAGTADRAQFQCLLAAKNSGADSYFGHYLPNKGNATNFSGKI